MITLKEDFAVKELFEHESVLKHFISDALSIPLGSIRSVRVVNPFLRRFFRKKKQGILDVRAELNDDTKVNIEIQIKPQKYWDRRQLFYLCRMYDGGLNEGDVYRKAKKCVSIAILDFNFSDREDYHSIYQFRDIFGNVFSDRLEIHIIELRKKLGGNDALDDWVRLFNAETEEDLDMITTANNGIIEAVEIMKKMSLIGILREEHEMRVKARRDRMAEDEYVRDEGIQIGETKKLVTLVVNQIRKHIEKEKIIDWFSEMGEDTQLIEAIYNTACSHAPDYNIDRIVKEILFNKK